MIDRELTDFLLEYVQGELDPHVRDAFAHHVASCRKCRGFLRSQEFTILMGRAAVLNELDALLEAVPSELVTAIRASRSVLV